jgi:hypothetical protein
MAARVASPFTLGNRRVARDDIIAVLVGHLDAMPTARTRVSLGTYRGLRFGMVLHPQWSPESISKARPSGSTRCRATIADPAP